ncbi:hypothetical protein RGQ29_027641 [Quercus rubra]|uniref:LysM domain-containing protein n=1 Tax=Quercus rubra TaxID=3512 RepID=A0AAN7EQX5_QUERU|nr:hypothetical protein RGQ29_027641 [Quercus rubra]
MVGAFCLHAWGSMRCCEGRLMVLRWEARAESKCSKGCSLALASYYVWKDSNLTFIAEVLQSNTEVIVSYNKQTIPNKDSIREGIRANVPFPCDYICGKFLGHEFNYTVNEGDTYTKVAQDYYANLTTYQFLQQTNSQYPTNNIPVGATLKVTINCSCGNCLVSNGYGLFIMYPLRPEDTVESIAAPTGLDVTRLESYN